MKKNLIKLKFLFICLTISLCTYAQGTLEMTLDGNLTGLQGPSTAPVIVNFLSDATNNNAYTFNYYNPSLTSTISFRNQTRSTTLTNTTTVVSGMTFGGENTSSDGGTPGATNPQQIGDRKVYNVFSSEFATGVAVPKNAMFMSSPSASPVAPTNTVTGDGNGLGLDVQGIPGGFGPGVTSVDGDANHGISLYNTVEPLFDANLDKAGRYYYGDLVITFNRPVKNPVIHIGGLGGSYNYQPLTAGAPRQISYFSTELELENSGYTSTFMSGNPNLSLVGNNILNSALKPNAGSFDNSNVATGVGLSFGFNNYGAASGSIRINGTVQELVYRVYVRGSSESNFNFSKTQSSLTGANRDPFNGDTWKLAISLDKPTQQISGNIYVDRDGLSDGNINKSAGVDNPKTNIGGSLFANLLNIAGQVVASTPVSSDGTYLFDAVPTGTYSVQLTINSGSGTYAAPGVAPATLLPTGWVNTGEFVGNTVGNDGTVNGKSSSVVVAADDIKVEVNFGIERLPESVSFSIFIPTPLLNSVLILNGTIPGPNNSTITIPVLSGSDPEDLPAASSSLSGRSVRIDSLPANSQLLYFNGTSYVPVSLGQVIPNYNPAFLRIQFTIATAIGVTAFKYSFIDAAGIADPTPATYTVRWPAGNPLAVTLAEYTATKNNCLANINWKTSSEINAAKFIVEYSTATNGEFKNIGELVAKGSSSSLTNYQFNYPMETGVVYYFRLKMVDKNGSFSYSVLLPLSCTNKLPLTIAPNPTVDAFKIFGLAKGKNTVSVFTTDGKLVKTQVVITAAEGIDISQLAKGIYVVKISNENGSTEVRRVVKN